MFFLLIITIVIFSKKIYRTVPISYSISYTLAYFSSSHESSAEFEPTTHKRLAWALEITGGKVGTGQAVLGDKPQISPARSAEVELSWVWKQVGLWISQSKESRTLPEQKTANWVANGGVSWIILRWLAKWAVSYSRFMLVEGFRSCMRAFNEKPRV